MTPRDFSGAFAGTEHYRERVASIQSWLEDKRCFGLEVALRTLVEEQNEEVEALCDHIEDLQKQNEQAWERAAEEARRVLKNGSKALKLEKQVKEQDKEIERLEGENQRLKENWGIVREEWKHTSNSLRRFMSAAGNWEEKP